MKDDRVYLHHIRECIQRIEENVAGGREPFMASHTLQDAVLRILANDDRVNPATL
jgi:uncharacterized protein with HEPN domain